MAGLSKRAKRRLNQAERDDVLEPEIRSQITATVVRLRQLTTKQKYAYKRIKALWLARKRILRGEARPGAKIPKPPEPKPNLDHLMFYDHE